VPIKICVHLRNLWQKIRKRAPLMPSQTAAQPVKPFAHTSLAMSVDNHYENFPVASILLPPAMRPFVAAIYRFARHADDIADEGDAPADVRAAALDALAANINALWHGESVREPTVAALASLRDAALPGADQAPFLALLSAFRQDLFQKRYPDEAALLDYCARSANPVGRLMLALVGVTDAKSVAHSDAICSALQLINFWQDAAIDASRGRVYVPQTSFQAMGLSDANFPDAQEHRELMQKECDAALALLLSGVPLVAALTGRFRWEIAFTIAGGQRILQKIAANQFDVTRRPVLRWYDSPRLLWLAIRHVRAT
jgi:hydroxysqualene synthase